MPSVTNWTVEPGRGQPSGTRWVTMKAGTSHGCWPSQPSATSNVRRPVSMAPTSASKPLRWSALGAETWNVMPDVVLAVGTSTSPEKYQSKTSATPSFASATYPSRDIDMIATTLLIIWCSFARRAGVGLSSETQHGRINHRSTPGDSGPAAPVAHVGRGNCPRLATQRGRSLSLAGELVGDKDNSVVTSDSPVNPDGPLAYAGPAAPNRPCASAAAP